MNNQPDTDTRLVMIDNNSTIKEFKEFLIVYSVVHLTRNISANTFNNK